MSTKTIGRGSVLLLLVACAESAPDMYMVPAEAPHRAGKEEAPAGSAAPASPAAQSARFAESDGAEMEDRRAEAMARSRILTGLVGTRGDDDKDKGGSEGEAAPTRSWFPETFLWEPRLLTNEQGEASIDVLIPDRLTEWRILALAHSRNGGLAGDVTSVLGSLPVYVDPVVPPFLVQGDRLRLPVQVVNTTGEEQFAALTITASGAASASSTGGVMLAPGASRVIWADLVATRAGPVSLRTELQGVDAVERSFAVEPAGRPIEQGQGGTLAAPRTIEIEGRADLDPDATTVRLVVYPGALAILRQELGTSGGREGLGGTAYALLLAGRGPELLRTLGMPVSREGPEPEARALAESLRAVRIRGTQRAVHLARTPNLMTALSLVEPALWNGNDPLLSRLGDRLLEQLAREQRPDGTFGGDTETAWTLQRLLVATAEAARAAGAAARAPAPDEETAARRKKQSERILLRASAAFERYASQVSEGYTAAAILASGAVKGELAERYQTVLVEALRQQPDGSRTLPVPEGVVRADGSLPSPLEATALAALALEGRDPSALQADLGAAVLGGWRPGAGWGDGRTDLVALQAVLQLFDEPPPSSVRILLARDGQQVAERTLDAAALRDLVVIEQPAPEAAGAHSWTVSAEPAVPGLGFQLSLRSFVPWEAPGGSQGLELSVEVPADLQVGRRSTLQLAAAAPAGSPLVIEQRLPAGVQVDREALSALVLDGILTGFHSQDGMLRLELPALEVAKSFQAAIPVTPTLSGTLHAGPGKLWLEGREDAALLLPPRAWRIGG